MPSEDAIVLRHPHHPFDTGQTLHVLDLQCLGVADEVDLGQGLFGAALLVHTYLHPLQSGQMIHQALIFGAFQFCIGIQYQNHLHILLV